MSLEREKKRKNEASQRKQTVQGRCEYPRTLVYLWDQRCFCVDGEMILTAELSEDEALG